MAGVEGLDGRPQIRDRIPTEDEIYHQHESEEGLALVMSGEVRRWEEECARAVRAAGRRATDGERMGVFDSADGHERPSFVGRYTGSARVTPGQLEREYGTPDPVEIAKEASKDNSGDEPHIVYAQTA